jgi:transcriptional regulator with XRE-family HTH domain
LLPATEAAIARSAPSTRYASLANVLRSEREAAGLTQSQLATALGWSQPAIAELESARRGLNVFELIDYARVLDRDPIDLFRAVAEADSR